VKVRADQTPADLEELRENAMPSNVTAINTMPSNFPNAKLLAQKQGNKCTLTANNQKSH